MLTKVLIDNNTHSSLTPEWGLSIYIEHNGHKLLLDTGASGLFVQNAQEMGVDLRQVELGVLSHAHYDHADGLPAFFAVNKTASFYLRRDCEENCYDILPEPPEYIGIRPGTLETYRDRIAYAQGNVELYPGAALLPHTTPGLEALGQRAGMAVLRGDVFAPDDFAHEQSLVLETEKGLVIFNSCSHGGADNIINEVAAVCPGRRIYALVGGLHLYQTDDNDVRALAAKIRQTGIEKLYTGHCTGERAVALLREELPDMVETFFTGMEISI